MQLQQRISKFVMLAMLFTVFSSPVNADLMYGKSTPSYMGCHAASAMTCCRDEVSSSQHLSSMCGPADMDAHSSNTSNCCSESNCHANGVQFAILSDFKVLSVSSSIQIFTEPEGKRQYYHDEILRPPVFV